MAFEPCKRCGHDIGCGCEYRLIDGIECCDFCFDKVGQKNNEENVRKPSDEILLRIVSEDVDTEPEVL